MIEVAPPTFYVFYYAQNLRVPSNPTSYRTDKLQGQFMLVCSPIFHSGHLHSDESLHCSIHKW